MLRLDRVHVVYPGGIEALKPTSLRFARREFAVLLGPSGAGKSTLLRCLNGLVPPTDGRVLAAGAGDLTVAANLRRHRKRTGMIFQHHQLIGRLTALENVLVGRLGYHSAWRTLLPLPRIDRRLALESLARVGLAEAALRRVDSLSGGQQQRVGIARALVQRPALVLADEPVASLDPATAHRVLSLLRRVCREDGIAAVVSLHQVELATAFADRVIGLAGGAVVFDGTPAALTDAALARIYDQPIRRAAGATARDRRPALVYDRGTAMEMQG